MIDILFSPEMYKQDIVTSTTIQTQHDSIANRLYVYISSTMKRISKNSKLLFTLNSAQ